MAARAATAAGQLCLGDGELALLAAATDALFATASLRVEAVHFAAGEALCCVFGGAPLQFWGNLLQKGRSMKKVLHACASCSCTAWHVWLKDQPACAQMCRLPRELLICR